MDFRHQVVATYFVHKPLLAGVRLQMTNYADEKPEDEQVQQIHGVGQQAADCPDIFQWALTREPMMPELSKRESNLAAPVRLETEVPRTERREFPFCKGEP